MPSLPVSESNNNPAPAGRPAILDALWIVLQPGKTYRRLVAAGAEPRLWIHPFIAVALVTTIMNFVVFNKPGVFAMAKAEYINGMREGVEAGRLSPEQAELAAQSMEERLRPFFFIVVHGTRDIKDNAVWLAVVSLWFWAGSRFLFPGDFGYSRAAQLVGPAMGGLALDALLTGIVVLATQRLDVTLSVGHLARELGLAVDHGFWDWIQPISLWLVYVLGVGLSRWGDAPVYKGVRFMALGWGALVIAALR